MLCFFPFVLRPCSFGAGHVKSRFAADDSSEDFFGQELESRKEEIFHFENQIQDGDLAKVAINFASWEENNIEM